MKIHKIYNLLVLLLSLCVSVSSCTDKILDTQMGEVSFTATLTADTKVFGEELNVDRLVVGVFIPELKNIEYERFVFPIEGSSVEVKMTLPVEQSYSFIFWAYNSECQLYNIEDLTAIKMLNSAEPAMYGRMEKMDVFYAIVENLPMEENNYVYPSTITLSRPLAQVNVGTTGIGIPVQFTAKGCYDTFNPFTKALSGVMDFIWRYESVTEETFNVEGKDYTYISMGYLFAPSDSAADFDFQLEFIGNPGTDILNVGQIQANYKTNIVGSLTNE